MIKNFQVDLAHYKPIQEWDAAIGDIIIYHGWISHWFGVVCQINQDGTFDVAKAGMPLLLLTMNNTKVSKSKVTLDLVDVKSSTGGKYAAIKSIQNTLVWHV